MIATLKIELYFESWFEEEREPSTVQEWTDFFQNHLMPEASVLGVDDEHQDMIAMSRFEIECIDISKQEIT